MIKDLEYFAWITAIFLVIATPITIAHRAMAHKLELVEDKAKPIPLIPKYSYGEIVKFIHPDVFDSKNCKDFGVINSYRTEKWNTDSPVIYLISKVQCFSLGLGGLHNREFEVPEKNIINLLTTEEIEKHVW